MAKFGPAALDKIPSLLLENLLLLSELLLLLLLLLNVKMRGPPRLDGCPHSRIAILREAQTEVPSRFRGGL